MARRYTRTAKELFSWVVQVYELRHVDLLTLKHGFYKTLENINNAVDTSLGKYYSTGPYHPPSWIWKSDQEKKTFLYDPQDVLSALFSMFGKSCAVCAFVEPEDYCDLKGYFWEVATKTKNPFHVNYNPLCEDCSNSHFKFCSRRSLEHYSEEAFCAWISTRTEKKAKKHNQEISQLKRPNRMVLYFDSQNKEQEFQMAKNCKKYVDFIEATYFALKDENKDRLALLYLNNIKDSLGFDSDLIERVTRY